ncbi:VPLPA-CTERM sorting domain-containing protein [Yoonia sp. R2331]|uniref:VPLPA-CTERM sorting domain-containing protein n=1 Tax=Yoonia sp. R2331 TaxID=3237238 RepID=UPI0034E4D3E7
MKKMLSAALLGLTFVASPALAAPIDVNKQTGSVFGAEQWKVVTSFYAEGTPPRTGSFYAGAFQLTADALGDFMAFCLQPLENLDLSKDYTEGTSLVDPALGDLNNLAANAFFNVSDAITAAAFQMAVWELAHDAGDYDIDDGDFRITSLATGSQSKAAADQAQTWLDLVKSDSTWANNAQGKNFLIISANGTQDLITNIDNSSVVGEVPVPASGLFLLAGLAGAGAVARRKARKAG